MFISLYCFYSLSLFLNLLCFVSSLLNKCVMLRYDDGDDLIGALHVL